MSIEKVEDNEHAEAGASSSEMWINCSASVTAARGIPSKSTSYAREGTAAHHVGELKIKGLPVPEKVEVEGEVFDVTDEMEEHLIDYVNFASMCKLQADHVFIEERVSLAGLFPKGIPEPVHGTMDFGALFIEDSLLVGADFKYGAGYEVQVENNPQVRIYLLGLLLKVKGMGLPIPKRVQIMIFQPRAGDEPVRTEELTTKELVAWFEAVVRPAIERLGADDRTENVGKWCKWCRRAGNCKSLANLAMETAQTTFDDFELPDETKWTNEALGAVLERAEMISSWVAKVRAEASRRIDAGESIPGWKHVAKRAERSWIDEEVAQKELSNFLDRRDLFTQKMKSPAGIEKSLKATGTATAGIKLILGPLVKKESSGTTLVPEDDRRPAVDTSATGLFEEVNEEDYQAPKLIGSQKS